MTGFGRALAPLPEGTLTVEVSSVNKKYLDMSVFLPKELQSFEVFVKRLLQRSIERGQVALKVFFDTSGYQGPSKEEVSVLQNAKSAWEAVAHSLGCAKQEITIPFLLSQFERAGVQRTFVGEVWEKRLEDLVGEALIALNKMRKEEGAYLQKELLEEIEQLHGHFSTLRKAYPLEQAALREKLQETISSFSHLADHEEKLYREISLHSAKLDIAEEIARLQCHLDRIFTLVRSSRESVGKEILFLVQEMNREVHTIAVKSSSLPLIQSTLAMKASLERIKEQTQNVQ